MKRSLKKLLALTALAISTSAYAQLEIQIGRTQPIGGFAKKTGFDQAGYAKQGTCFQLNAMGEDGDLKMTMSVFAGINKFDLDAYQPQFIEANKASGKTYTRFEVGKYLNFGFTAGPEYRLQIGEKLVVPIRAHVGFQMMMPPLKFNAYYTELSYFGGPAEESYDNIGGNFVYEVLGLNYRLGSGLGYKLSGGTTLMARVDYNNRFLGGQMTYGNGEARSTYPKKFTNIDFNIGFAFGFD
ncbi:MAG TPA: hypothetical protein VGF30_03980 [Bacteroidia bacterium]